MSCELSGTRAWCNLVRMFRVWLRTCVLQARSPLAELPHTSASGGTVVCGSLGSGKLGHTREAGAHGTGNLITVTPTSNPASQGFSWEAKRSGEVTGTGVPTAPAGAAPCFDPLPEEGRCPVAPGGQSRGGEFPSSTHRGDQRGRRPAVHLALRLGVRQLWTVRAERSVTCLFSHLSTDEPGRLQQPPCRD